MEYVCVRARILVRVRVGVRRRIRFHIRADVRVHVYVCLLVHIVVGVRVSVSIRFDVRVRVFEWFFLGFFSLCPSSYSGLYLDVEWEDHLQQSENNNLLGVR